MKARKGISPVIATALLILIAIATGILIYAFAVGWVGSRSSTASGPQAVLVSETAYCDTGNNQFVIYVRNDGTAAANITRAYVTHPNGTTYLITGINTEVPANGSVVQVTVNAGNIGLSLTKGQIYAIKLVATDGSELDLRVRC